MRRDAKRGPGAWAEKWTHHMALGPAAWLPVEARPLSGAQHQRMENKGHVIFNMGEPRTI